MNNMNVSLALKLGRVSNLPTVWTNCIAGIALAGGQIAEMRTPFILLALSLFYVAGMFLNDAYDAEIDAVERPERPIPSGQIDRASVFSWAFGLMAVSLVLLLFIGYMPSDGTGLWPAVSGMILAGLVVLYNRHHKANKFSPLIMGLCRAMVYFTAGLCFATMLSPPLVTGAVLLVFYLIGLTYVAKQENLERVENMWPLLFLAVPMVYGLYLGFGNLVVIPFGLVFAVWTAACVYFVRRRNPGDIPRAVTGMIAGISLFDAVMISSTGNVFWAVLAVASFGLTLYMQKHISGT